MKQIFTLVALLFLSLAASGQHATLKSSQVLKQRLDSVGIYYWDAYRLSWDTSFFHYVYNDFGQTTLFYTEYIDNSSGELLGEERYEYTYNPDGSIAGYLYLSWDEAAGDWEKDKRYVYYYAAGGIQKGYVTYDWNQTGEAWIPDDSTHYTHNDDGLIIEYTGDEWKTDRWVPRYLSQYSYDQDGRMMERISRMWYEEDQEWKNNIKWLYTWNPEGKTLTETRYDQEIYEGPWVEESMREYTYGTGGLLLTKASLIWSGSGWELNRADTMDYDAGGLLVEDRGYVEVDETMEPNFVYTYAHDASGNLEEYIYSDWDDASLAFVPYSRYLYTYDLDYDISDVKFPREDTEWQYDLHLDYAANIPRGSQMNLWKNDAWEDYKKIAYFYSEMDVLGLEEDASEKVRLYPNPVSDQLQVELPEGAFRATLSLYEITGRQVLRRELKQGSSISLATLNPGIYLYTLSVDGKIQGGKLLKR